METGGKLRGKKTYLSAGAIFFKNGKTKRVLKKTLGVRRENRPGAPWKKICRKGKNLLGGKEKGAKTLNRCRSCPGGSHSEQYLS